jgi:transcriptional regulator with XRE-family HTH domain
VFLDFKAIPTILQMADFSTAPIQMQKLSATRRNLLNSRPRRDVTSDVSKIIGRNLREARKQRGYSLDTLARKSGVSRAMLGQIETAKSVPTVTVIWRVADALGIAIGALISNSEPEPATVTRANDHQDAAEPVRRLGQAERSGESRFYEIRLPARQSAILAAQTLPLRAILAVAHGAIGVEFSADNTIELEEGDTMVFDAQQAVRVVNNGTEPVMAYLAQYQKRAT